MCLCACVCVCVLCVYERVCVTLELTHTVCEYIGLRSGKFVFVDQVTSISPSLPPPLPLSPSPSLPSLSPSLSPSLPPLCHTQAMFDASELITQREVVSQRVNEMLQERAQSFHILLDDISLVSTHTTNTSSLP